MTIGLAARRPELDRIGASLAEARDLFARAFSTRRGRDRVLLVSVPMPKVAVERFFGIEGFESAVLWAPPEGPRVAGLGAAATLVGRGEDRFAQVRSAGERLFERLDRIGTEGGIAPEPRLFGGFAFAAGGASEPGFAALGDALFVLPRWTYVVDEDGASLTFASTSEHVDADRSLRELEHIVAALGREGESAHLARPRAVRHEAFETWRARVDVAREAIDRAQIQKVVLARRSELELTEPLAPALVLERLGRQFPLCTRFALRTGDATFLSTTPERLMERRGKEIRTEAMAGSIGRGRGAALLASEKDRIEHGLVVDAILERLAPRCESLERSAEPRIRELPNVLHLDTPICGRLKDPTHVLELVRLLHPTPAVGGVPSAAALALIGEVEPTPRGWYSGPVGFFDREGDGEFVVALRSGLLLTDRAYLYAGAGIVRGSRAELEYEETALKMQALLEALEPRP